MLNEKKVDQTYEKFILMLRMINRHHMSNFGKLLKDPRRGQGRVLRILKMKSQISQKELLYLLDISKQSLAETLSKLEKEELIIRKKSDEDKRVLIVELTEKGKEYEINYHRSFLESFNILEDFDDKELENFNKYLDKIISHFENEEMEDDEFIERRKAFEKFMIEYNNKKNHK